MATGPFKKVSCSTSHSEDKKSCKTIVDGTISKIKLRKLAGPELAPFIKLNEDFQSYRHITGSCPDLVPTLSHADPENFASALHILDHQLYGCDKGTRKLIEFSDAQGNLYKIEFEVEFFITQPEFLPTVDTNEEFNRVDESGEKLEGPPQQISAWNHAFSALLYSRAVALKKRGNHLFEKYKDSSEYAVLEASHACYVRALQLVQSLNLACCFPKNEDNDSSALELIKQQYEREIVHLPPLIEEDSEFQFYDIMDTFNGLTTLEFKILLNLSACHLKANALSQAIDQCTRAIELRPTNESNEGEPNYVSRSDLAKAYYRRAVAYFEGNNLDEAKSDLINSLKHVPESEPAKKLLEQVDASIANVQNVMKNRLKKMYL